MEGKELFEQFDKEGALKLPGGEAVFKQIPWNRHPVFEGVELKHIVTSAQTGGRFSYHLVRIAPGKSIGAHVHETQLETHEVIEGQGCCINGGARIGYKPGIISIFPENESHQVTAGSEGLYLFAKFIPALN